jgi:hypothetical protein
MINAVAYGVCIVLACTVYDILVVSASAWQFPPRLQAVPPRHPARQSPSRNPADAAANPASKLSSPPCKLRRLGFCTPPFHLPLLLFVCMHAACHL